MIEGTSGFTFTSSDPLIQSQLAAGSPPCGMQILFSNGYFINVVPDMMSKSKEVLFSTVALVVGKEDKVPPYMTDQTIATMKKLSYNPSYEEMEKKIFLEVCPTFFATILTTVANFDTTYQ